MPGSANHPQGLPDWTSTIPSQTHDIIPAFQMKTLEFRQIMQFAEVQRASNSRTGIRAIPLIPNHEVMHKETEDDKHFNNTGNTNV